MTDAHHDDDDPLSTDTVPIPAVVSPSGSLPNSTIFELPAADDRSLLVEWRAATQRLHLSLLRVDAVDDRERRMPVPVARLKHEDIAPLIYALSTMLSDDEREEIAAAISSTMHDTTRREAGG